MPPIKRAERTPSTAQRELEKREGSKQKRNHYTKSLKRIQTSTESDEFKIKTLLDLEYILTTLTDNWLDYKKEYSKIFDDILEETESDAFEQDFVNAEQ